ncbi:MAG TPA: T9SS type A sorting domain-containing protein, partial [Rhodothermales bacterium]|nr:T9SS type A sorting domain-containing protein [Rhodothermales bacterium]
DEEAGIATGTLLPGSNSCVGIATAGNVRTTCEVNAEGGSGGDPGSFRGVGIEDFGTELVLTGNMQAGWYRYRMKWHFYPDGRIWPEYSYSAASATCTSASHRHHAYWRFDFDLEGTPTNDVIREVNPATSTTTQFTTEVQRTWGTAADGVYWTVRDGDSNVGYDIVPSTVDRLLAIDSFSKLDFMALQYHAGVYDDGVTSLSDCAIHQERMVDTPGASTAPENIVGVDTEVWYRSSALHNGGNPWECDIVGPSLRPQGYTTTQTGGEPAPPVDGLVLESARPNPFNPTTSIRFRTAEAQYVTVKLYDVTGREVAVLFEGYARENREEIVRVDGTALPGGTYIVRLEGERVQGSTRVVLLK